MLSVADAARTVIERVPRLGSELVPLDASIGRILATPIVATRALPGFDNSAMDGYAVRAADLPGALPIAGIVAAGAVHTHAVPPGSCVRIYTGAPLPADLDTVVMQEDVTVANNVVTFPAAPRGSHVRRAGDDVAIGDAILAAGTRIVPWHIGLLAALGIAQVPVSRRPRVAIIATGDELVPVDIAPGPGQLVASSTHALLALIAECGGEGHALGIARDDIDETAAMIARALGIAHAATSDTATSGNATSGNATSSAATSGNATSGNATSAGGPSGGATSGNATSGNATSGNATSAGGPSGGATSLGATSPGATSAGGRSGDATSSVFDVVITTGGVSVGDRDHVHAALAAAGVRRELYKVAMKPGKPFAFGLHPPLLTPVFGLPGNPVSTLVAFELFMRPALLAMQGAAVTDRARVPVQLAAPYRKQAGRAHYLRASITREGERLIAHVAAKQGSAQQSSLVGTSALVEVPAETTELDAGALVTAILLDAV